MNFKKKLIVVIAAGIMVLSASTYVMAATPKPADNTAQAQTQTAQTTNQTTELTNKKYLTKGGATAWFIIILLVNGGFSFWVGHRFYRMAKKDNHVASEMRALRRDVEEKFALSIGGFAEKEVEIKNTNKNLAADEEGIKPPEKNITFDAIPDEEERFRRWAAEQAKPKTGARTKSPVRRDLDDNMDGVRKIRKKNYRPRRDEAPEDAEPRGAAKKEEGFDSGEDLGETRVIPTKGAAVKNKTKELLNDIFPFKED